MKKLFVGMVSVALAVGAYGQASISTSRAMKEYVDISQCLAAISHPDAIEVYRSQEPSQLSYSGVLVLMYSSDGNLERGYYQLRHLHYSLYPETTSCSHYRLL